MMQYVKKSTLNCRTELIKKEMVAAPVGNVCQFTIRHARGQGG